LIRVHKLTFFSFLGSISEVRGVELTVTEGPSCDGGVAVLGSPVSTKILRWIFRQCFVWVKVVSQTDARNGCYPWPVVSSQRLLVAHWW